MPPHATHVSIASTTTGATRRGVRLRPTNASPQNPTTIVLHSSVHPNGSNSGGCPIGESIAVAEGAVVPTLTVTDCAAPLICTDELDKLQVGPSVAAGVTAQLRSTAPLNVPDPAKLRLKVAVSPALTVCDVDEPEAVVMLKSGSA